jgi:hypothetical protein
MVPQETGLASSAGAGDAVPAVAGVLVPSDTTVDSPDMAVPTKPGVEDSGVPMGLCLTKPCTTAKFIRTFWVF